MEGPKSSEALLDGGRHRRLSAALDEYVTGQITELADVDPDARRLDRNRLLGIFRDHGFEPTDFGLDITVVGESELLLSLRLAHAEVKLVASLVDDHS